ncbi:MAG: hypothetical protein ACRCYY_21665 [Trueperaceae bacterium]
MCWLTEEKELLVHGSSSPDIALFEPRAPDAKDENDFSLQKALYASSEGIWPMFYAILDRANYRFNFMNSAVSFKLSHGWSEPHYFFPISKPAFQHKPWHEGSIYILPKDGFVLEPYNQVAGGFTVQDPHWANFSAVKPLAKLFKVKPEDFPFLQQIRGHDQMQVSARYKANPKGFPWL